METVDFSPVKQRAPKKAKATTGETSTAVQQGFAGTGHMCGQYGDTGDIIDGSKKDAQCK
jgi:hypothetical protein